MPDPIRLPGDADLDVVLGRPRKATHFMLSNPRYTLAVTRSEGDRVYVRVVTNSEGISTFRESPNDFEYVDRPAPDHEWSMSEENLAAEFAPIGPEETS